MHRIHDQLFKGLGIAFAADLVILLFPDVAKHIDLGAVRFESKEYFLDTPRGRLRFPDLVARVRGREDPTAASIVHVEHFYRYRSSTRPRLWDYNRLLGMRYGLPVHTAAVYIRGGPQGLQSCEYEDVSHGRTTSVLFYGSLGLSRSRGAEYLDRPQPLAWALASVMRPEGIGSRAELALASLRRIVKAAGLDEARRFLLLNFVRSYIELDRRSVPEYEALLRRTGNSEVRHMMMTWAEKQEARGLEKGLREGRLQGMRDLVLFLASQRFGDPTEELRQRVAAVTSPRELKRLSKRMLEVDSLGELGVG